MVFKSFRLFIFFRLILLSITIYGILYLFNYTQLYFTEIIISLLFCYQIFSLTRFLETTNRGLTRFLNSVKYSDFTQSFSSGQKGSSFNELNKAFDDVIKEFHKARMEKEEHYRYLQTVIRHIGIGLIAYDVNGDVDLINNAFKKQLKLVSLNNINHIKGYRTPLKEKLLCIKPGERDLVKIHDEDVIYQFAIYATAYSMRNINYLLVSIQNIQSELDEKEMESWQKLIRVLTHEIMNSITPISSLSGTAHSILESNWDKLISDETEEALIDVKDAVKTIENRSKGMMNFVQSYRSLTHIPHPEFEVIAIEELFNRMSQLMKPQFEKTGITCTASVEPNDIEITVDTGLIEQVIINIVKNAIEAVRDKSHPEIGLSAHIDDYGKAVVQISDNGQGMEASVAEQIFIPFFTTKAYGSGIGLAFSKQVMRLHNGTISVKSKLDVKTVFTLRF